MNRMFVAGACAATFVLSSSVGATAAGPAGGCPPGFDIGLLSIEQSADLILASGYPGTRQQLLDQLPRFDKNSDQMLCVMDYPDTNGIPSYVFNFVDNRVPQ